MQILLYCVYRIITNLFSSIDCQENDKIIYKYFKDKYVKRKLKPWLQTNETDETKNYLLAETKHNNLMSEQHRKVCRVLNCFETFSSFGSAIFGFVLMSLFDSLVSVLAGITSFAVELKICALTVGTKKHRPTIKKNRK